MPWSSHKALDAISINCMQGVTFSTGRVIYTLLRRFSTPINCTSSSTATWVELIGVGGIEHLGRGLHLALDTAVGIVALLDETVWRSRIIVVGWMSVSLWCGTVHHWTADVTPRASTTPDAEDR
ncbi:unnamed protein product [Clonostachys rosea]|uniref:Uncharacterized protein n=1 Tax=Bionectria ochroleuca TaxID=29856 RepID=A0ABY6V371_BIOOC|nr:unnamed protein product [Clonostachys rosea]